MKNKQVSLPDEIYELLKKEENASALISRLLNEYFQLRKFDDLNGIEKLKAMDKEIAELQAKIEYQKKLKEIKNG